ncbi:MAG: 30S ribosomal protein S8 [Candidatus Paceibacterota bacterium]|jgi:small subunit ribosomal protein S8
MVKDSVANLIIKIKNAGNAGNVMTEVPYSKLIEAILSLLEKEGYIKSFAKKGKKIIKSIDVELAYEDGKSKIEGVERISKLSKRTYAGVAGMRPVRSGYGLLVVSTPKGILTSQEAKKANVGGEVLFKIW